MDRQHSKQRHDSTLDHIASAQPLCIGPSIWMIKERCSRTWQSNLGLVEFNTDSNTFSDIILFPLSFKNTEDWLWLSICKYKDDSIVIVDGDRGLLIVFNTTTRTFGRTIVLKQQIGSQPNCIAFGDYIHIFQGDYINHFVTIVSMLNESVNTYPPPPNYRPLSQQAIIRTNGLYESSKTTIVRGFARNQSVQTPTGIPIEIRNLISKFMVIDHEMLMKFGSARWSLGLGQCDSAELCSIGKLKNGHPGQAIQWTVAPQYSLKLPIHRFGYIQHGPFVVIFAGNSRVFGADGIYILDLRSDQGWAKSPIECPRKGQFVAVLDVHQNVHLFDKRGGKVDVPDGGGVHFCIELDELLESVNMK